MYFVNYGSTNLVPVNAKTLAGAKRASSQNCIFQGQTARVFSGDDAETAVEVARKVSDPVNMNRKGTWVEM